MSGESSKLSKEELREDEFVEWIMNAVDYVRDRSQLFIGGLVGIVVVILAVNYIIESQEKARDEASTKLGEALIAEENGQPEETVRILEQQVLEQYDGTPAAAQGTLFLANRYLAQGNYSEARRLYERYLDDYGQNELLNYGAMSGIASCMEAEGQIDAAGKKYVEYADKHSGTVQAGLALWEAARCQGLLGNLTAKKDLLERITREYAKLPLASQAKAALAML